MKQSKTSLNHIKLAGLKIRTNNQLETDPTTAKIPSMIQAYFDNKIAETISDRKAPGTTYCVYTNYDNDLNGDYDYFIGETVRSFEGSHSTLETILIPPQTYTQFTKGPGVMPNICIEAWKNIWQMNAENFSGERAYIADFEVYDERSRDPQNSTIDIYVGIKQYDLSVNAIRLEPLIRAFTQFEKFMMNHKTPQERAGIIQAFEYCFELSWKTMQRILKEQGQIANSPRETFRMAALDGLIEDPEQWFDFLKKRNLTVHTYNEKEADAVFALCHTFESSLRHFLERTIKLNDHH